MGEAGDNEVVIYYIYCNVNSKLYHMKILSITFLLIFYSIVSLGQNQICFPTNIMQQSCNRSEIFLHSADVPDAQGSSDHILFAEYAGDQAQDNCIKYKKMKRTGTIVASVGGGLLAIGAVLIPVGIPYNLKSATVANTYGNGDAGAGLIISGTLSLALGFCGVSSGIPLAVIGSKRMKKYCGESKRAMMLNTQGTGLALNF